MKAKIDIGYAEARANEYPTVLEYIEAVTEKELGRDEKWLEYLERLRVVRDKYPKPIPTKEAKTS